MKILKSMATSLFATIMLATGMVMSPAQAETADSYGIGVSPMKERIILNPGESFASSFTISNPASNTDKFNYQITVSPFYATEDYNITYEETGDFNQIVKWIDLDTVSGTLEPNSTKIIDFVINVPEDAPAGGQYAAIIVGSNTSDFGGNGNTGTGISINQAMGVAHTIFAEINGTTNHNGEIESINLPSFLFDGKIISSASIRNTGNVHGTATYKLQIYPLFSSEEIFTNEEDPETSIILPGRTLHHETVWNETPPVGIFNVVYTVEYEGMTSEISKLVIICPLWVLFIIIFVIVALIVWIVIRIKSRKKAQ